MEEEAKPLEGGRAAHDLGGQSGEGGGGVVREGKRRRVRRENKGKPLLVTGTKEYECMVVEGNTAKGKTVSGIFVRVDAGASSAFVIKRCSGSTTKEDKLVN